MRNAETDDRLSLPAQEFVWRSGGLSDAHRYLWPTVSRWLEGLKIRSVLDLGCGNGAVTALVAQAGFDTAGVDGSSSGIEVARSNHPGLDFRLANLEEPLPVEFHGRFEAVLALEVVEHLLRPRLLFERAREALIPGGSLILSTPYHGYWKNLAIALVNGWDAHWHPLRDFGHIKFFSIATLAQLFQEQDFDIAAFARVGRIPFLAKSMILRGVWAP